VNEQLRETAGLRLRRAIEQWGSQRKLARELADLAVETKTQPIASYATVRRYIRDNPTPPLDFLEVASRILNVNFAWLATGQGSPERKGVQTGLDAVLVPATVADQIVRVAAMQRALAAELAHIAKQLDED
jgi:hypothetical protein